MVLSDVVDIVIDVNGVKKQVEKITDLTPTNKTTYNKVIWQVPRCKALFRDNIPVNLYYDIGDESPAGTIVSVPLLPQEVMYLVPIGTINCNNESLTGFNSNNYVRTPIYIEWTPTNSFEFIFKLTTGSNVSTRQEIFSMTNTESHELEILNGKLHWELAGTYSNVNLTTNTDYWIRFTKNGSSIKIAYSRDGITFAEVISSAYNRTVKNEYMHFGVDKVAGGPVIEPFLGKFDLTQWSITYDNKKYKVKIHDENYINLIRDGNIQVNDQVISNFTSTAYAHTPFYINWSTQNETTILMKIKTGTDILTRQELFGMQSTDNFELEIYNEKLHWELGDVWSTNYLLANTEYMIEFKKNKTKYEVSAILNNGQVAAYVSATSNRECFNQYLYLGVDKQNNGIEAFKGTIDCKGSYLTYNNKKYKFRI